MSVGSFEKCVDAFVCRLKDFPTSLRRDDDRSS